LCHPQPKRPLLLRHVIALTVEPATLVPPTARRLPTLLQNATDPPEPGIDRPGIRAPPQA
jgi:hypothetical protein